MFRRSLLALIVGVVGVGMIAAANTGVTHADSPYRITNIGAQSGSGAIVYNVCVLAPSTNPPEAGGVTIVDSGGQQHQAGLVFSGSICGPNLYSMQAQFAGLPGGQARFQSACVLLTPTLDSQGTPVAAAPGVPCLTRGSGLVSNFSGDTVEQDCQVDVDPNAPTSLVGCRGPGVSGIIGGGVMPPPTPTKTATATPTNTATPTPTNTATPPATNTPVPTATSPSQTGGGGGGAGGSTPPTTPSGGGSTPGSSPTPPPTSTSGSQIIVIQSSNSGAASPQGSGTTVPQSSGTATAPSDQGTATSGTGSVSVSNPSPGAPGGSGAPSSSGTASKVPAATPVAQTDAGTVTQSFTGRSTSTTTGQHTGPLLRFSVRAPLVRPGETQHLAVSYVERSLIQAQVTYPGTAPQTLYDLTDAHGRLSLALAVPPTVVLHNGRAQARIALQGLSGPFHKLTTLAVRVRPGTTTPLSVTAPAHTWVRAIVTLAGQPARTLYGRTDGRGRLRLSLALPRTVGAHTGRAVAQVAVWALSVRQHAHVQGVLALSDLLVRVTASAVTNCQQTQVVHVTYKPLVALRVILQLPQGRTVTLRGRTDTRGNAAVPAHLSYAQVASPVHLSVQVVDARPRVHRSERVAYPVTLPQACQPPSDTTITIGG